MLAPTHDFFHTVIENKKREVEKLKAIGMTMLGMLADAAPKPLNFLERFQGDRSVPIIAEIKKSAPSWNGLKKNVDIVNVAKAYQYNGAAAISVLTDSQFFGGSIDDLTTVRYQVSLPLLRKDFIIGVEQLYESRAAQADAVLLIVAILDDYELSRLYNSALSFGMTPLLEVHDEHEAQRALKLDPRLIGINNRNLKTLGVDLGVSERLRKKIPEDVIVIAESGVATVADVQRLLAAGVNGFLIGTALMKSADPGKTLNSFVSVRRV
ncbi:MAG: indole-3-glycerol phosphate synthase TrpC [Deltaproteobacteria bacterium]|nr:indole-3-glycerol phosphate synthase TrpC [Deltaproteobacteria bacterium]